MIWQNVEVIITSVLGVFISCFNEETSYEYKSLQKSSLTALLVFKSSAKIVSKVQEEAHPKSPAKQDLGELWHHQGQ